jgi:hypothetical protein
MKPINYFRRKRYFFLILIVLLNVNAFCNNSNGISYDNDTILNKTLAKKIIWNILTYKIYEYLVSSPIKERGIMEYEIDNFASLFPPDTCDFYYYIEKISNLKFPDSNYVLYNFHYDISDFKCSNLWLSSESSYNPCYDRDHLIAIKKIK